MIQPRLDVLAIGDAIVDVIAIADEAMLVAERLPKGSMRLISPQEAERLYGLMGSARETSGGSAANTMAGLAAMGGRAGFVGQVAADQLGAIFSHDIRAAGVEFVTDPLAGGLPTGRCLILVTPDAQRTMNTCAGASHLLSVASLDEQQIREAGIVYVEGYLMGHEGPRAALRRAISVARDASRKVAFTLSDIACIARGRSDFLELIEERAIDILFGNEAEIKALAGRVEVESAISDLKKKVPLLIVTRSERGAVAVQGSAAVEIPACPIDRVVDTTGAGDLFAAGFLFGQARKCSLEKCLFIGAIAAREVIGHFGARPQADLKVLIEQELGGTFVRRAAAE